MNFDQGQLLRKATLRAKSDVANKLVSMLLHELSRRVNQESGLVVNGMVYSKLASSLFGNQCPYCSRELLAKHVAVEHLDGMNRLRCGLHIPGNVVVSCSDCNREKRRDDQCPNLYLAPSGWESFLSHDFSACDKSCKTCGYWINLFKEPELLRNHLHNAKEKIHRFRHIPEIAAALKVGQQVQTAARETLESFYREGQEYAQRRISELADAAWPRKSQ
ncbi:MAG: hypothetical protein WCO57_12100 [Verrucomicrobiota bacterium]